MTDKVALSDVEWHRLFELMRRNHLKSFGEVVAAIRRQNTDWSYQMVAMDGAKMLAACAFSGTQTFVPKLDGGDLLLNVYLVISRQFINSSKAPKP